MRLLAPAVLNPPPPALPTRCGRRRVPGASRAHENPTGRARRRHRERERVREREREGEREREREGGKRTF